jgi:beta-glucosidase
MARVHFPVGFRWGAATASYQIEGGWNEGGKGPSIWDEFSHTPGKIRTGDTGDRACDSYHRWKDDVALCRAMSLNSYRFSIAWPRIQPEGSGKPNATGLDYYGRLADALLEAGIRPFPTLYHWDLPLAIHERGGWPERDTAARFAEYAQAVVRALGDRVKSWLIFNEPGIFTNFGYGIGIHAPGIRSREALLRASHVVNLAHGDAYRALRAERGDLTVGTAFSMSPTEPATDDAKDAAAAERMHAWTNEWFLRPSLKGEYPNAFLDGPPYDLMGVQSGDFERMKAPLDVIGINLYFRSPVRADSSERIGLGARALGMGGSQGARTEFGWEVWPDSLYSMLMRVTRDYGRLPIEITENGCSYADGPGVDGKIRDQRRIDFYRGYIGAVGRAIQQGCDVRGYHAWTLMDNFEWAEGFAQRFGLAHVDFTTCDRTIKQSGHWYGRVAAQNSLDPEAEGEEA